MNEYKTEYVVMIDDNITLQEIDYPETDLDAARDCFQMECEKADGEKEVSLVERTIYYDKGEWYDKEDETIDSNY